MYRDIPTNKPGIRVHITGYDRKNKQGHIVLRGYPIDSNGVRLDGSKKLCRKAKNETEIPTAEQHLVAAVMKALPRKAVSRGKKDLLTTENSMVKAFDVLTESGDIISADWNPKVRDRWMSYFRRNVLPRILQYTDEPFGVAEREQLLGEIIGEVAKKGNSKGNRRTIVKTAKINLASADVIYQAMRRADPELPAIELAPARSRKIIQTEQIKSLPRDVRRKFARALEARVEKEPLLVLDTACMWDGGARTAEAAAVIPDDFEALEGSLFTSLWILWQEKDGKRNAILKSDAAYRRVPLSHWGTRIVEQCIQCIQSWPENKMDAPMTAEKLASWIKALLKECGCDENFWNAAVKEELSNPELDSRGKAIYDVVAYVLRRDRSSRWRNICGLLEECDYLLGHGVKKSKKRKIDYSLEENQVKIAQCCERYVYDKRISLHPAYCPIKLIHGVDNEVMQFESLSFVNSGDVPLMVTLDLVAAEAAEEIELILGETAEIDVERITVRHKNTHGERENKTVIGTGQVEEDDTDEPVGE